MAASLATDQTIKANQGDSRVKVSQKFALPAIGFGAIELFAASAAPNKNIAINEDGNSWNPCEGPADYGQYKTRLMSYSAKSTNTDDVTVLANHDADDGDPMKIVLRPGSGFMIVSPYGYDSQIEVNENTEILVSGTGTDQYSAIWAIG